MFCNRILLHNTLPYTFTVHSPHKHNTHNTFTAQTKHTTHNTRTHAHTKRTQTQTEQTDTHTHHNTLHNTHIVHRLLGLRFMLLLKALSRSRSVLTCDGETGQFINVAIIFATDWTKHANWSKKRQHRSLASVQRDTNNNSGIDTHMGRIE